MADFYIQKTLDRIRQREENECLLSLTKSPYLLINKNSYKNFSNLKDDFIHYINNVINGIYHHYK